MIAEVGNNHNGSVDLAKRLVDLALEAGADAVKFQLRDLDSLYRQGGGATAGEDLGAQYTIDLLRRSGAAGISVDLGVLGAAAYEELATAIDEGARVFLGVAPSTGDSAPSTRSTLERALRLLDMLGFDREEVSDQLVLTPACGLAGASPSYAKGALGAVRAAAAELG